MFIYIVGTKVGKQLKILKSTRNKSMDSQSMKDIQTL